MPDRAVRWRRTALVAAPVVVVAWLGNTLDAFRGPGIWLVLPSAVLLVAGPQLLVRSRWLIVPALFVAGVHLAFTLYAGPGAVGGVVLAARGVETQARVVDYTDDWTRAQFRGGPRTKNAYTDPDRALVVVTPDGQRGVVGVRGNKPGDTVTVVVDPRGAVDLHRPGEASLWAGAVFATLDLALVVGFAFVASKGGSAPWNREFPRTGKARTKK